MSFLCVGVVCSMEMLFLLISDIIVPRLSQILEVLFKTNKEPCEPFLIKKKMKKINEGMSNRLMEMKIINLDGRSILLDNIRACF